ncbi:MAG: Gfo/Idh/MocA family oxidoreductase [Bacilli bacterium]
MAANGQWNRAVTKDLEWPKKYEIPADKLKKYGYKDMAEFRNWRWNKGLGGGAISDLGAHQIDIFGWMLGARPTRVMASKQRLLQEGLGRQCNVHFEFDKTFQAVAPKRSIKS